MGCRLTCSCGEVGEHQGEGSHKEAGQLVDDADLLKDHACGRKGRRGRKGRQQATR